MAWLYNLLKLHRYTVCCKLSRIKLVFLSNLKFIHSIIKPFIITRKNTIIIII